MIWDCNHCYFDNLSSNTINIRWNLMHPALTLPYTTHFRLRLPYRVAKQTPNGFRCRKVSNCDHTWNPKQSEIAMLISLCVCEEFYMFATKQSWLFAETTIKKSRSLGCYLCFSAALGSMEAGAIVLRCLGFRLGMAGFSSPGNSSDRDWLVVQ